MTALAAASFQPSIESAAPGGKDYAAPTRRDLKASIQSLPTVYLYLSNSVKSAGGTL